MHPGRRPQAHPSLIPFQETTRRWAALAAALTLVACSDAASDPRLALAVDGTPLGADLNIHFVDTPVGAPGSQVTLSLESVGTGTVLLTGDPAVRLEHDDHLAFTVTQPKTTRIPAGTTATIEVVFHPRRVGATSARLRVETNVEGAAALLIGLNGTGTLGGAPALSVSLDGAPVSDRFEFGAVPISDGATRTLRLDNTGTGTLKLEGVTPLALTGPDAASFAVTPLVEAVIQPDEGVTATLTFSPSACERYTADLIVTTNLPERLRTIALSGEGLDSPIRVGGVADLGAANEADISVVATEAVRTVVVANPTDDTYAGNVQLLQRDGCGFSQLSLTADEDALGASLFGSAVAIDRAAANLLVTAEGHDNAWIYRLRPAQRPLLAAALGTDGAAAGFGASAALSGDGTTAVVGQPLATTMTERHGAALVYGEPRDGWANLSQGTARLLPMDLSTSTLMGEDVATDATGDTIAVSALYLGGNQRQTASAYVYQATEGETWGRQRLVTNPWARAEDVILLTDTVAAGAHVLMADDGLTIVVTGDSGGNATPLHVFLDDDGDWTDGGARPGTRPADVTLTASVATPWRSALGADGQHLLLADKGGVREIARPATGWTSSVEPARSWPAATFGGVGLSPDGAGFASINSSGDLQVYWR